MKILLEKAEAYMTIKNSRFIAEAFPIQNQIDARETILLTKQKYPDATHVVHAFILGLNREVCGMSDDGEPPGTAGRPVLSVLRGSGITNILLTITRYFGGTLLGTGGLVRAYGESAKKVLSLCRVEEYREKTPFSFSCGYDLYPVIKHLFESYNIFDLNEEFGTDVFLRGKIFTSEKDELLSKVKSLSRGNISCI